MISTAINDKLSDPALELEGFESAKIKGTDFFRYKSLMGI